MLGQNPITILLLLGLIAAPFLASALGVFRLRSVSGPDRIAPPTTGPQLTGVMLLALIFWVGSQAIYGGYLQTEFSRQHGRDAHITEADFTPVDWAVLSTAPALLAFVVLMLGDLTLGGRSLVRSLGLTIERLPGGVAWGIVGAAIVLPISFFVAGLTTWIYDRIHFQHPQAHELLLQMNSANGWIRADLVIAATIIAPLFEELLFRGHLQTLIRRVLHPRRRHIWPTDAASPPAIMTQPVLNAAAATPAQPATPDNPPIVEYATPPMPLPGVRQTWLAILIASMLFTAVHPMWMWPPLFVLAVGLGYAYERTGNLWTCMTMHCAFNSVSTAAYLLIGK